MDRPPPTADTRHVATTSAPLPHRGGASRIEDGGSNVTAAASLVATTD